jgi:hypothetical protein
MARETTNTGKLGRLQQFSAAMEANKDDLPHLEVNRVQLVAHLTQAQESVKQQAAFRASKQEASRQFRTSLSESERVANVLRVAVIQHFGMRAVTIFDGRGGRADHDQRWTGVVSIK